MKNEPYFRLQLAHNDVLLLPVSLASQILSEGLLMRDEHINGEYVLKATNRELEIVTVSNEKVARAYAIARLDAK